MSAGGRSLVDLLPPDTFTPREYQVELFEEAVKRNVIISLRTGSGKTFIAIMLIKELSAAIRRPWSEGGQRTFFLVNSVPLVSQQADAIRHHTDLAVGEFVGSQELDMWEKRDWDSVFKQYQVLVMSAQIFLDILVQGFLSVRRVNLVIFDECHHAVKDSPMRLVVQQMFASDGSHMPRVLGASASVINRKITPYKLESAIEKLEATMGCVVRTSSDILSVTKYCTRPCERIVECDDFTERTPLHVQLSDVAHRCLGFLNNHRYAPMEIYGPEYEEFLRVIPDPLKEPRQIMNDFVYVLNTLGPCGADRAAHYFLVEVERMRRKTAYERHFLLLGVVFSSLTIVRQLCSRAFDGLSINEQISNHCSPKVTQLFAILLSFSPDNQRRRRRTVSGSLAADSGASPTDATEPDSAVEPLSAIVFVKQRITAKTLFRLVKEMRDTVEEYSFVLPQFVVGSTGYMDASAKKQQESVLRRFRMSERNLLLSTAVLEEGVDIPRCNLVVRFDRPLEFRAYVQSKGRARAVRAYYLLLVTASEKEQLINELADYHLIEKALLRRCTTEPEEPRDTDQMEALAERFIQPYRPGVPTGAVVTRNSAIALVNRYCSKLPSDSFTRLTPCWRVEKAAPSCSLDPVKKSLKYRCSLRLPVNSPFRDTVIGDWMPSTRLAKQAAAVDVCRQLHQIGELDDYLLPIGKEVLIDDDATQVEEELEGCPRPGTTKRRQYYRKHVADCFAGSCGLGAGDEVRSFYLYRLHMRLTCPIPDEQNTRARAIFRPEQHSRSLGIITVKPIPQLCEFPVFTRSGEVLVAVQLVTARLQLSGHQVHSLLDFHGYLFSTVLRLHKFPMQFSAEQALNSGLVVPINGVCASTADAVDWPFVRTLERRYNEQLQPRTDQQRADFVYDAATFQDAVVMPWYRNTDQPQCFYVAEVLDSLSPESDFPDGMFQTFCEYYRCKYNINIQNHDQPLLDVDHTSVRLNLLTPRYVNRKGVVLPATSADTKRAKREQLQQKQILVPELCAVHPLPGSFWRKAVSLPSILYRLNGLLTADSLRRRVAAEIQLGLESSESGWGTMDFGWVLSDVLKRREDGCEMSAEDDAKSSEDRARSNGAPLIGVSSPKDTVAQNFNIDTWTNELLAVKLVTEGGDAADAEEDMRLPLPEAVTLLTADGDAVADDVSWGGVRYGSPTYLTGGWPPAQDDIESCDSEGFSEPDDMPDDAALPVSPSTREEDFQDDEEDEDAFDFFTDSVLLEQVHQRMQEKVQSQRGRIASRMVMETVQLPGLLSPLERTHCTYTLDVLADSLAETELEWPVAVSRPGSALRQEFYSEPPGTSGSGSPSPRKPGFGALSLQRRDSSGSASLSLQRRGSSDSGPLSPQSPGFWSPQRAISLDSEDLIDAVQDECVEKRRCLPECDGSVVPPGPDFDWQPHLDQYAGPSPALLLQALTMSSANDGLNLERLETVGDSFLKFAVTTYLFITYPRIHEGKLSYMRSKRVSNLNLYRLGSARRLGPLMVSAKFEPHDNWLPPGFVVPRGLEEELVKSGVPAAHINVAELEAQLPQLSDEEEVRRLVRARCDRLKRAGSVSGVEADGACLEDQPPSFLPYNLLTQQSIPDKSVADCVEALIGAYLVSGGQHAALVFMTWLGLKVLPRVDGAGEQHQNPVLERQRWRCDRPVQPVSARCHQLGVWQQPDSPLHANAASLPPLQLASLMSPLLQGLDRFERVIGYRFNDRSYLLQAFTHASYYKNVLTDCYQRLEFLGDAVLDYLITRHLYEDRRNHGPGALTDLRSALVNNTIFATLAVRYSFHRFFRHYSPGLNEVIARFLATHGSEGDRLADEYIHIQEDECADIEDVEIPKALGDLFESVAGAVYMDSGMSLAQVWRVYYPMMRKEIDEFSANVPKSPIRELLELEPDTAKFRKPERCVDGKMRVTVDVFGKGSYSGLGRNYRIAKCTAAKRALRALKRARTRRDANASHMFYGD